MPKSVIAKAYGRCIFSFIRNQQTVYFTFSVLSIFKALCLPCCEVLELQLHKNIIPWESHPQSSQVLPFLSTCNKFLWTAICKSQVTLWICNIIRLLRVNWIFPDWRLCFVYRLSHSFDDYELNIVIQISVWVPASVFQGMKPEMGELVCTQRHGGGRKATLLGPASGAKPDLPVSLRLWELKRRRS